MRRLLVLLSLLTLAAACTGSQDVGSPASTPTASSEAAVAPADVSSEGLQPDTLAFTASTVDGGTLDGAELAGTDVALWFWAPWCGVCNREAPDVAEVASEVSDVRIVGVAGRDATGPMQEFVERHGLDGIPHVDDVDGAVWSRFGIVGQPAWVFVDGDTGAVEARMGTLGADALRQALVDLSA